MSNKGFIKQFAPAGTKVIAGKYVSAWGGIQSAGQTVGQVVSLMHSFDTEPVLMGKSSFNLPPIDMDGRQRFSYFGLFL